MNEDLSTRARRLAVLRRLHRKLLADLRVIGSAQDVEALHHARVDARRLRVIIRMLAKECRPQAVHALLFDLRDVGRALAPAREADVRTQDVESLLRREKTDEQEAGRLLTQLRRDQADAWQALHLQMRTRAWSARLKHLEADFDNDDLLALPRSAERFKPEHAALKKRLRKIQRMLRAKSAEERIHALRIQIKRLRYTNEFLLELDKSAAMPLPDLQKWQTLLGKMHDALQTANWLRVTDMSPSLKQQLQTALQDSMKKHRRQFNKLRESIK